VTLVIIVFNTKLTAKLKPKLQPQMKRLAAPNGVERALTICPIDAIKNVQVEQIKSARLVRNVSPTVSVVRPERRLILKPSWKI
jgi:hypothetical protein